MAEEEKIVTIEPASPDLAYSVMVKLTFENDPEKTQVVNIFADTPTKAYSMAANTGKLYEEENVTGVSLVGIYKRIGLKVVEETE